MRDGPTVKLKKIKATVLKSTGQLPRMREKLHELKLVAVYDARRVGHRDKCMRRDPKGAPDATDQYRNPRT